MGKKCRRKSNNQKSKNNVIRKNNRSIQSTSNKNNDNVMITCSSSSSIVKKSPALISVNIELDIRIKIVNNAYTSEICSNKPGCLVNVELKKVDVKCESLINKNNELICHIPKNDDGEVDVKIVVNVKKMEDFCRGTDDNCDQVNANIKSSEVSKKIKKSFKIKSISCLSSKRVSLGLNDIIGECSNDVNKIDEFCLKNGKITKNVEDSVLRLSTEGTSKLLRKRKRTTDEDTDDVMNKCSTNRSITAIPPRNLPVNSDEENSSAVSNSVNNTKFNVESGSLFIEEINSDYDNIDKIINLTNRRSDNVSRKQDTTDSEIQKETEKVEFSSAQLENVIGSKPPIQNLKNVLDKHSDDSHRNLTIDELINSFVYVVVIGDIKNHQFLRNLPQLRLPNGCIANRKIILLSLESDNKISVKAIQNNLSFCPKIYRTKTNVRLNNPILIEADDFQGRLMKQSIDNGNQMETADNDLEMSSLTLRDEMTYCVLFVQPIQVGNREQILIQPPSSDESIVIIAIIDEPMDVDNLDTLSNVPLDTMNLPLNSANDLLKNEKHSNGSEFNLPSTSGSSTYSNQNYIGSSRQLYLHDYITEIMSSKSSARNNFGKVDQTSDSKLSEWNSGKSFTCSGNSGIDQALVVSNFIGDSHNQNEVMSKVNVQKSDNLSANAHIIRPFNLNYVPMRDNSQTEQSSSSKSVYNQLSTNSYRYPTNYRGNEPIYSKLSTNSSLEAISSTFTSEERHDLHSNQEEVNSRHIHSSDYHQASTSKQSQSGCTMKTKTSNQNNDKLINSNQYSRKVLGLTKGPNLYHFIKPNSEVNHPKSALCPCKCYHPFVIKDNVLYIHILEPGEPNPYPTCIPSHND